MDLKQKMNRLYLDRVINELRLANYNSYQHVTYNSLLYLDIIAYRENCTVSYIAQVLRVAKSAVTLKVKELQRQGLVEKRQSSEDRRIYYLKVNETLREEYKAYDQVLYDALDELERTYSPDQVRLLCDMLDSINKRFQNENDQTERNSE